MKPLVLTLLCLFVGGCASTSEITEITLPEIIYQHPLPPFPKPISSPTLRIELQIHVSETGDVLDASMTSSSGAPGWDTLALAAVKRWRYLPARGDGKPMSIWLRQPAIVRFSEPNYLTLALIACTTPESADSAFAALRGGMTFSEAVEKFSTERDKQNGGRIGVVNIQTYPEKIKTPLSRLGVGGYSSPHKYGDRYVIFTRLPD